jgi:hypothetical protein
MPKIFLFVLVVFLAPSIVKAQNTANDTLPIIDSAAILNDLAAFLAMQNEPVSYTTVELGLGNRLFSLRNNRLNAKQNTAQTMVYSPTITYYHKSGINIAAGANLLNQTGSGFGASQYSLTGGYDLVGNKKFDFGISYTRYFVNDSYSPYASPIQNDFYLSGTYKKLWLHPGLAVGYATGKYNQARIKDTVVNNIRRVLYDSATFNLKSFSLVISASHSFEWTKIFNHSDEFSFTPTLMLNLGNATTNITHKSNAINLLNFLNKKGKLPKLQSTAFQAESIGLNLNAIYSTGNFSVTPQLYLDYYLHSTTESNFSEIFMITLGYSF